MNDRWTVRSRIFLSHLWDLNFHVSTFQRAVLSRRQQRGNFCNLPAVASCSPVQRVRQARGRARSRLVMFVSWKDGQVPSGPSAPCTLVPKRGHDPVWRHWNISFWKVGVAECPYHWSFSFSFFLIFIFIFIFIFIIISITIIFIIVLHYLHLCHHWHQLHEIHDLSRLSGGLRFGILQLSHSVAILRTRFRPR